MYQKQLQQTYKKLVDGVKIKSENITKKNDAIYLATGKLFLEIIENMPPRLVQANAEVRLDTIYEAGYHTKTGAMFVCNKGAYLLARTIKSEKYYPSAHVGFAIYMPQHGIETVDVGIAGDITQGDFIILRPESACSPSFIIGSQRCNCFDQWTLVRELAAMHNPIKLPKKLSPEQFEKYIFSQFVANEKNIPIPKTKGLGFLFIHMASQNGMGSGVNEHEFVDDMTATAYMRHRGEYTAEQVHSASLAGGFTAIGLVPDPRKLNNRAGYKIPGVILDYYGVHKPILALTNNVDKVEVLQEQGFDIMRVQFVGRSDIACGVETKDRTQEFLHNIPIGFKTSQTQDLKRVNKQIHDFFKMHRAHKK